MVRDRARRRLVVQINDILRDGPQKHWPDVPLRGLHAVVLVLSGSDMFLRASRDSASQGSAIFSIKRELCIFFHFSCAFHASFSLSVNYILNILFFYKFFRKMLHIFLGDICVRKKIYNKI